MSVWTNLYIGTSGIRAHGDAIGVVGDNIANVSTTGFKGSRAGFSDVLGGTMGESRLGSGVTVGNIQTKHSQGTLQQTGQEFDLAIRGTGFFAVNGTQNGVPGPFYTRDGRFALDAEGYVVNSGGLRLQGYEIDTTGTQSTQLGDLQLGVGQNPPRASTSASISLNLDADAIAPAAWDPVNPDTTSNFATSMTVFDSLGADHRVDLYFRTNGGGSWEWHAMVDGGELNGGTAGVLTEVANGTMTFTTNGELDTEAVVASSADFLNAAPGQAIAFDFGDAITTDGGTGVSGTTQFSGVSNVTGVHQDGYGFGALASLSIDDDGTINGAFSNGQRRPIARVALATFASEAGLQRAGDSLFAATAQSGQALVDAAATGSRGSISAGAVETSNVDIGDELVTLIAYQRAFQANARTVTTADEMLAEVANLKR